MKKVVFTILVLNIILVLFLCTGIVNAVNNNVATENSTSTNLEGGVDILSDTYLISETNAYIGRILPRTTVEQFKLGFNVPGENIHSR